MGHRHLYGKKLLTLPFCQLKCQKNGIPPRYNKLKEKKNFFGYFRKPMAYTNATCYFIELRF